MDKIYSGKFKGENCNSKPIQWRFSPMGETIGATCGDFNSLNTELNTVCHLLALLGAHHILHVSRMRVMGSEQNIRCLLDRASL